MSPFHIHCQLILAIIWFPVLLYSFHNYPSRIQRQRISKDVSSATDTEVEVQQFLGGVDLGTILENSDKYKESSRVYRRTVFKESDWAEFRASDRLFKNLKTMFISGTVRGLLAEVGSVLVVSTIVWITNFIILSGLLEEFGISRQVTSLVSLPVLPFQLSSPALGLLLVFRTNTVYSRWNLARLSVEQISCATNNLSRQGLSYLENNAEKEELVRRTIALLFAIKKVFRFESFETLALRSKLTRLLGTNEATRIMESQKPYVALLADITRIVRRSKSIDGSTKARFDLHLDDIMRQMTLCEGLKKTPVPLVYTRHTNRFLSLWVLLLPFALVRELEGSAVMIPVACLVGIFLFGIEELGVQLEEPFTIMPVEDIVHCAEQDILQMLEFQLQHPNDPIIGEDAAPDLLKDVRTSSDVFF